MYFIYVRSPSLPESAATLGNQHVHHVEKDKTLFRMQTYNKAFNNMYISGRLKNQTYSETLEVCQ